MIQQFRYKGFEAEVNFQPNKHVYATASYSYIDAKSSAPFQYGLFGNASEMFGNAATVPIGTVTRVSAPVSSESAAPYFPCNAPRSEATLRRLEETMPRSRATLRRLLATLPHSENAAPRLRRGGHGHAG